MSYRAAGLDDARLLTGHDAPDDIDVYLKLGAEIVALTLGKAGTLIATSDKRAVIPAFSVDAVDATAAGDTFDGAFLAEILAGRDAFAAGLYANAAAALSTTGYGAVAPMPDRAPGRGLYGRLNHRPFQQRLIRGDPFIRKTA